MSITNFTPAIIGAKPFRHTSHSQAHSEEQLFWSAQRSTKGCVRVLQSESYGKSGYFFAPEAFVWVSR